MSQCTLSEQLNIIDTIVEAFELNETVDLNDLELEISETILDGFTWKEFRDNVEIIKTLQEYGVNTEELFGLDSSSALKSNIVKNISTYNVDELFKGLPVAKKYFEGYVDSLMVKKAIIGNSNIDHYVSTDLELSENLQDLKNEIFIEIQQFLISKGLLNIEPINLFENGRVKDFAHYSQIVNLASDYFFSGDNLELFTFSGKSVPNLNINLDNNEDVFRAYNNIILLSNFDSILNTMFKGMIEVNYNYFNHLNSIVGDVPKYKLKVAANSLLYWNQDTHDSKSSENKEDQITKMIVGSIPMYNKLNIKMPEFMEMKDLYLLASMIHNFELKFGNKFKNNNIDFEYFNVNSNKSLLWYIDQIKKAIRKEDGYISEFDQSLKIDGTAGYSFKNAVNIIYALDNFINDPELNILNKEQSSNISLISILSQILNNNYGSTYSVFNSKEGLIIQDMYQQDFNSTYINTTILNYMKANAINKSMYDLRGNIDERKRFDDLFKDWESVDDIEIYGLNNPKFVENFIKYITEKTGIPLSKASFTTLINEMKDYNSLDRVGMPFFRNQVSIFISALDKDFNIEKNKPFQDFLSGISDNTAGSILRNTVGDSFYKSLSTTYLSDFIVKPVMNIETSIGNKVPSFRTTTLTFKDTELFELQREFEQGATEENYRSLLLQDIPVIVGTAIKLELVNQNDEKSKDAVKATIGESFISDFGYEFLNSINKNANKKDFGTFQIILGNYSDKNSVFTKMVNSHFQLPGSNNIIIQESMDKILETVRTQSAKFYKDSINKVVTDYIELLKPFSEYSKQYKSLNNSSNFASSIDIINSLLSDKNFSLDNLIERYAALPYSERNPNLTITEELHYSKYANGLALNQTLVDNFRIFNDSKLFSEFVSIQEESFVSSYNQTFPENSNRIILGKNSNISLSKAVENLNIPQDTYNNDENYLHLKSGELNPLIRKWLWLNTLFRNEYIFMTAKGEHMHPHKNNSVIRTGEFTPEYWNQYRREVSGRLASMAKRNVIFTAVVETPVRNSKMGIPDDINVAAIKDNTAKVYTPSGYKKYNQDAYDGSSYIDDTYSRMLEASFPGKGYSGTKKQFGSLITQFGITIKKDAETVITNDKIRNSFNSDVSLLNKKKQMLGISLEDIILNWSKEYSGDYFYIDKGVLTTIDKIELLHNGTNNQIKLHTRYQNEDVWFKNPVITANINNLYDIWNLVGGIYSTDRLGNFNEGSNELLYDIVTDANDGDLKSKIIHVLSNKSALKAGATNLNPASQWNNDKPLMYSTYKSRFMGPQLDASHGVDDSEIKEITQLISALAQNGFTSDIAQEVYENIANVIRKSAQPYINNLESDNSNLYQYLANKFIDTINISKGEGLAKSLVHHLKEDKIKLPFSNASFFSLFVRDVVTRLNNEFISRHYSGIGSILLPSHGVIQLYDRLVNGKNIIMTQEDLIKEAIDNYNREKFITKYGREANSNDEIVEVYKQEILADELLLTKYFEVGDTIKVITSDPSGDSFTNIYNLVTPEDYYELKEFLSDSPDSQVFRVRSKSRDLKPTMHTFSVNGLKQNVYDFQSIKLLYKLKDLIDKISKDKPIEITEDVEKLNLFANYIANRNNSTFDLLSNLNKDNLPIIRRLESYLRRYIQREFQLLDKNIVLGNQTNFADLFGSDNFTSPIEDVLLHYQSKGSLANNIEFRPAEKIIGDIYQSNFNRDLNDTMYQIYTQGASYFKNKLNKFYEEDKTEADIKLFTSRSDNPIYIKYVDELEPLDRTINIKSTINSDEGLRKTYTRYNEQGQEVYSINDSDNVRVSTDENGNEIIYVKYGKAYQNNKFSGYHKVKGFERNLQSLIKSFKGSLQAIVPLMNQPESIVDYFTYSNESGKSKISGTVEFDLNEVTIDLFKRYSGFTTISDNNYDNKWLQRNKDNILNRLSNNMFASWQKSHDLIDARIPGQSMQSFMPMRNVAYMKTLTNDSYVSINQIYLQGSDFDIDKAYTLGSSFTANGTLELWSDLSNYSTIEQLNELEKLPIPTGLTTNLVDVEGNDVLDVTNDYLLIASTLVGVDYTFELPAETISLFNNLIRKLNSGNITKIIVNANHEAIDPIYFRTLIDKHNLSDSYLKAGESIKNSVVSGIKRISANPSNQIIANTPVDVEDWHNAIKTVMKKRGKIERKTKAPENNNVDYIYSQLGDKTASENVVIDNVAGRKPAAESNLQNKNVKFEEEQTTGYRNRTIKNASADATIAIAVDFNSAGEKLTKSSVLNQGKKYIPLDANNLIVTQERVNKIVNELNSVNAKTLNIAGNGIYTMKGKYTQQQVDDFTYELLNRVINSPNLKTKIQSIRSGGQTGFDEAGTKAGIKLGIPTLTLAPKGWTFRNINGQDISNEQQFKERFKNIQQSSKPIVAYRTRGNNFLEALEKDNAIGNPWGPYGIYKTADDGTAVKEFIAWMIGEKHTDKLQDYRQAIIDKIPEMKGKTILYYKDLGRPSHATALDYLINNYKFNSNPILQGNQEEQIKKFTELQERLNNKEFLEGAKNAYESTPELQQFGTQEEYNDYIARVSVGILPNQHGEYHNSKVKDIVYHGSNTKFDKFNKSNLLDSGIYFDKNKATAYGYGSILISAILNSSGYYYGGNLNRVNSKQIKENGETGITNGSGNIVFEPEQIHILGSKQDVEGFKDYVDKRQVNQATNQNISKINIYSGTGENSDLSNFAKREFDFRKGYEDKSSEAYSYFMQYHPILPYSFNSVEQAFQAFKFASALQNTEYMDEIIGLEVNKNSESYKRGERMMSQINKIINETNSAKIKQLGNQKGILTEEEIKAWDEESSRVMKFLISQSFEQNPEALQKLLDTGNAILTHTQDKSKWGTEFPKILMEVREELGGEKQIEEDDENITEEAFLSPYDILSYYKQQYNASVGKDDVGIAANGVKTLYALSSYYNNYYKKDNLNNLSDSFKTFEKTFSFVRDGKRLNLGGTFTTIADVQIPNEKYQILKAFNSNFNVRYSNAANNASGFLSAATDNAKELIMAKVNASTDLAAMHLYLLILGVDIESVVDIMTSPVIEDIIKVMEGNIFNSGDTITFDKAAKELAIKYNRQGDIDSKHNLETYKDIYRSAQELTILSRLLGINQKRTADTWEMYRYLNMFSKAIKDAEDKYINYKQRGLVRKNISAYANKIKESKQNDILNGRISSGQIDAILNRALELNILDGGFNFELYFSDPTYKQATKEYYNLIKETFNIFDVLDSVPHFKEMINSLVLFHNILKKFSSKYNYVFDQYRNVTKNQSPNQQALNRGILYYDTRAREEWLRSEKMLDFTFNLKDIMRIANKDSFTMYTSPFARANSKKSAYSQNIHVDDELNPIISLDTNEGIANFKIMFEQLLLPILQANLKDNNFLKIEDINMDFGLKRSMIAPTIPLSSSHVPALVKQFQKALNAFNSLDRSFDIKYQIKNNIGEYVKWRDLLFVYNLIVNNEKYGNKRITPLFEDYMQEKDTLGYDYVKFWSKIDNGLNLISEDSNVDIKFFAENEKGELLSPRIVATNTDFVILTSLQENEKDQIYNKNINDIVRLLKEGGYIITLKC